MGSRAVRHDLAPRVLLRAAAFPMQKLAGFGNTALAGRARAASTRPDPDFAADHARVLDHEREHLHEQTVADRRFMTALAIANPQLARRATSAPGRPRSTARARRLDGALFRHLSRAVGRTEPADLWAGVALADWSDRTVVRECPPVVLVHPDLRPFQSLLRAL